MAFDPSHLARSIPVFQDMRKTEAVADKVKVEHAWEQDSIHEIMGVPPHIKELVELMSLRKDHAHLLDKVCQKVMRGLKEHFEARHIGGGETIEARVCNMTAEGCKQSAEELVNQVGEKLDSLATAVGGGRLELQSKEQPQERETHALRASCLGQVTRLPNDFQFPSGNALDCWLQWSVGSATRQVPPL